MYACIHLQMQWHLLTSKYWPILAVTFIMTSWKLAAFVYVILKSNYGNFWDPHILFTLENFEALTIVYFLRSIMEYCGGLTFCWIRLLLYNTARQQAFWFVCLVLAIIMQRKRINSRYIFQHSIEHTFGSTPRLLYSLATCKYIAR